MTAHPYPLDRRLPLSCLRVGASAKIHLGARAYDDQLPVLVGPSGLRGEHDVLLGSGRVANLRGLAPDADVRVTVMPHDPDDPDIIQRIEQAPAPTLGHTIDAAIALREAGLPHRDIRRHLCLAHAADLSRCLAIADRFPDIREAINRGQLKLGHATMLMRKDLTPGQRRHWISRAIAEKLSVGKLRQWILDGESTSTDQDVEEYAARLSGTLGAPVRFSGNATLGWTVQITWYTLPILVGVLERMARQQCDEVPDAGTRARSLELGPMSADEIAALFGDESVAD